MYNRNSQQRSDGTVQTKDFVVAQAYNGHIHVYERESGKLVLHVNRSGTSTKDQLQAFADRFQAANSRSVESTLEAMQALA